MQWSIRGIRDAEVVVCSDQREAVQEDAKKLTGGLGGGR